MSDLRTLPAIRAEAERLARETYEAQSKTLYAHGMGPSLLWDLLPERMRTAYVGAHIDLLCDLSRPASMDAVARLVAAKVGMFCHDTAPLFERHGADWKMTGTNGQSWWFAPTEHSWLSLYGGTGWTVIADLPPDFQEALRLIALHVLRSPDV